MIPDNGGIRAACKKAWHYEARCRASSRHLGRHRGRGFGPVWDLECASLAAPVFSKLAPLTHMASPLKRMIPNCLRFIILPRVPCTDTPDECIAPVRTAKQDSIGTQSRRPWAHVTAPYVHILRPSTSRRTDVDFAPGSVGVCLPDGT